MDLQELSSIAEEEPQIALSAFNKGLCHRWTFVQRTMSDIEDLFKPLETSIREDFIPALIGRSVSDLERKLLQLPVRFRGLGIANPASAC